MVSTLQTVEQAMCGGNLDFVWNFDKRGVVLMTPTVGGGWLEEEDSIKSLARKSAGHLRVSRIFTYFNLLWLIFGICGFVSPFVS